MNTIKINKWTECYDVTARAAAVKIARGSYQRDLINGRESISGSTLAGKAASYSAGYRKSARNLIERLAGAGVPVRESRRFPGCRRVLVIGEPPVVAWTPSLADVIGGAS